MFSAGFSSGAREGRKTRLMLFGTARRPEEAAYLCAAVGRDRFVAVIPQVIAEGVGTGGRKTRAGRLARKHDILASALLHGHPVRTQDVA